MGLKPSDFFCVPLTSHEHAVLHQMGERRFWECYGLNPADAICRTMRSYLGVYPDSTVLDALNALVSESRNA